MVGCSRTADRGEALQARQAQIAEQPRRLEPPIHRSNQLDDILRSYVGLLATGQSDYEAVSNRKEDEYFREALGIGQVPSAETLRHLEAFDFLFDCELRERGMRNT